MERHQGVVDGCCNVMYGMVFMFRFTFLHYIFLFTEITRCKKTSQAVSSLCVYRPISAGWLG